jgi:hypothetical protein
MRTIHTFAVILSSGLLAAACTSSTATDVLDEYRTEAPSIDRLTFSTSTGIPQNAPPDVAKTITGSAAQTLYQATLALPAAPTGAESCPADWGVAYHMQFSVGSELVLTVDADPSGCELFQLTGTHGDTGVRALDNPDYWSEVATDLGISETEIYPYAPPS